MKVRDTLHSQSYKQFFRCTFIHVIMIEIQQLIYLPIGVFNAVTKSIHFAYLVSVLIGQRLAECIVYSAKATWSIIEATAAVLKILYEDYMYFVQDVAHKAARIASILWSAAEAVAKFFVCSYCSLKNLIYWTQDIIISYLNVFLGVLEKVYNVLVRFPDMLRHAIVLIGTGCYFALQIIPVAIVYVLSMIVFMVGRSFEEIISIISFIKNGIIALFYGLIQFFVELPPEAVVGLAFGCVVLYMSVRYASLITEVMKHTVLFCRGHIHHAFMYVWVRLERFLLRVFTNERTVVRENEPVSRPSVSKCQVESEYSDLCVVCQDRQKCIIIFPCRHLCLCRECCAGIQQQSGRCPLCRRTVSRVMKVYV